MRLTAKMLLCVGLSAAAAGEGVVVYSRRAVHAELLSKIENRGLAEAREFTGAYSAGILASDERRILPLLQAYLQSTGAAYAVALDQNGRVLSHTNVGEVGRVYDDAPALAARASPVPLSREIKIKDRALLDLSVPVFDESSGTPDEDFLVAGGAADKKGRRVGTLLFGLPLDDALASERRISAHILRIVLGLGLFTGVILYVFMQRLLAPIGLLAAATARIGRGDSVALVPVTSGDELGELARSFNAMARELGATTVSKKYLDDILDHIQDQLVVADADGAITLVNPAILALLGYSEEELIGRHASLLLGDENISFTVQTRGVGTTLAAKDGKLIPVLFSSSVIVDSDGEITGWIGAAKDISDLKRLEARIHQSEKLSAVGQLAAGVAHEINNPLGVILGFAQAMSRVLKPGDENELPVKSIEREALRCKALVQNLLTFARTSHSDRVPMDLNTAVAQSLALIEPQAKMGRVKIAASLGEGLPPVLANKGQLEQVIMNLAKNAIDAMPDGGCLELRTELAEGTPNSWVCLKVVDDGTGIPDAVVSKIFDPFFTTKPIGQGTGLGLSLVSEIVQKHSGQLSVDSRPGRTEFTIKLPVRTGRELDQRTAAAPKGSISHS